VKLGASKIATDVEWLAKDAVFKWRHRGERLSPLPNAALRFRVAGTYGNEWFHASGLKSRQAFEQALAQVGKRFTDFRSVLDFGVGCGRIMRWMRDLSATAMLCGVDIDPPAVAWCARNLPYAHVQVNQGLPPLNFPDATFDLVYSHSVFTHLDDDYQDRWLAELRRVTRPGALLLLTVLSEQPWQEFYASAPEHPAMIERKAQREQQGFLFVAQDGWTGLFPDFYHSMFHTEAYVREHWSQIFAVRAYLQEAMLGVQDIVVLEHTPSC
jgi:SAM-dependent methyltransferase